MPRPQGLRRTGIDLWPRQAPQVACLAAEVEEPSTDVVVIALPSRTSAITVFRCVWFGPKIVSVIGVCCCVIIWPDAVYFSYSAARGAAVGWGTALETARWWVWFPSEDIEIFQWLNPSRPEVDSASNRNEYQLYFLGGGVKAAEEEGWPYRPYVPNVMKSGSLSILENSRHDQTCVEIALPFLPWKFRS